MNTEPKIIPCATRDEWLHQRTQGIGASEVETILGLNKDKENRETPRQLWERKREERRTGLAVITEEESDSLEAGRFSESGNAEWYAYRSGRKVVTPQDFAGIAAFALIFQHPSAPLFSTLDRVIVAQERPPRRAPPLSGCVMGPCKPGVLELKNADRFLDHEWTDDEDKTQAAPPLRVQIQVQAQLLVTGLSWGAIGAIVGGNRRRDADVQAHPGAQALILRSVIAFWASLDTDNPPDLQAGDYETMRTAFGTTMPGRMVEVAAEDAELITELALCKARLSLNEKLEKRLKAELLARYTDAETLTLGGVKVGKFSNRERAAHMQAASSWRQFDIDKKFKTAATQALEPTHELPL